MDTMTDAELVNRLNDLISTGDYTDEEITELKDIVLLGPLYNEDVIYTSNYYEKFLSYTYELAVTINNEHNILKYRKDVLSTLEGMSDEELNDRIKFDLGLRARTSYLKLLLTPLNNGSIDLGILNNKRNISYSNFNIDINFFNNIRNTNITDHENGNISNMLELDSFSFRNGKLYSFDLVRLSSLIKYSYNKDYKQTKTTFSDGTYIDIGETKGTSGGTKKLKSHKK